MAITIEVVIFGLLIPGLRQRVIGRKKLRVMKHTIALHSRLQQCIDEHVAIFNATCAWNVVVSPLYYQMHADELGVPNGDLERWVGRALEINSSFRLSVKLCEKSTGEAVLAVVTSLHPRIGAGSRLHILGTDIVRLIVELGFGQETPWP